MWLVGLSDGRFKRTPPSDWLPAFKSRNYNKNNGQSVGLLEVSLKMMFIALLKPGQEANIPRGRRARSTDTHAEQPVRIDTLG